MDYGLMKLPNGDQVRLYGTPGQKRFDFMWDILARDALGLVLMLKANAPNPVDDLRLYASEFRQLIDETSLVVGMTHTDRGGMQARQKVARALGEMALPPTVMDTDARNRQHIAAHIQALVYSINPFLSGSPRNHRFSKAPPPPARCII